MFDEVRMWCCCPIDTQLLSHRETSLSYWRVWSPVWRRAGLLGSGLQPGGTLLLDDLHYAPQHARDAPDPRPSGSGHRQTDGGGYNEEIRFRGHVQERRAELLAEHQAKDLGAVRRTQLFAHSEGQSVPGASIPISRGAIAPRKNRGNLFVRNWRKSYQNGPCLWTGRYWQNFCWWNMWWLCWKISPTSEVLVLQLVPKWWERIIRHCTEHPFLCVSFLLYGFKRYCQTVVLYSYLFFLLFCSSSLWHLLLFITYEIWHFQFLYLLLLLLSRILMVLCCLGVLSMLVFYMMYEDDLQSLANVIGGVYGGLGEISPPNSDAPAMCI